MFAVGVKHYQYYMTLPAMWSWIRCQAREGLHSFRGALVLMVEEDRAEIQEVEQLVRLDV